jgi:hypothetical protein
MAILGTLVAVVAPEGQRWVQDYRLKEATEMVAADLRLLRQGAVAGESTNWEIRFNFASDPHQYLIKRGLEIGGTKIVRRLPSGIAFEGSVVVGNGKIANVVRFNLEGTPNSGSIDITIPLMDEVSRRQRFVKVGGTTGHIWVTDRR